MVSDDSTLSQDLDIAVEEEIKHSTSDTSVVLSSDDVEIMDTNEDIMLKAIGESLIPVYTVEQLQVRMRASTVLTL